MNAGDPPSIALGCIARFVDAPEPYIDFLRNAQAHGRTVDTLVLAVSRSLDLSVAAELDDLVSVEVVQVGDDDDLPADLADIGADPKDIGRVLDWAVLEDHGLVPYEIPRNAVMLRALLAGVDVLIFFDHNMRPYELVGDPTGPEGMGFRQVDFVGAHIEAIEAGAALSTGGYSGYDAFPPVRTHALRDLLHGIGREEAFDVIARAGEAAGLHLAQEPRLAPRPAFQTWGGNLAVDLRRASKLPAFYSGWSHIGEQVVLARGEDTLLGAAAVKAGMKCTDVGTRVFLDPHESFPERPRPEAEERLRERLYWNCLGWVARLPLLDWVRKEAGLLDWSLDDLQSSRRLALMGGSEALAELLDDQRFLDLPTFFDLAYLGLERTVERYHDAEAAWHRLVAAIDAARYRGLLPSIRRAPSPLSG